VSRRMKCVIMNERSPAPERVLLVPVVGYSTSEGKEDILGHNILIPVPPSEMPDERSSP
jgi:hypothetical protein